MAYRWKNPYISKEKFGKDTKNSAKSDNFFAMYPNCVNIFFFLNNFLENFYEGNENEEIEKWS